MPRTGSPVGSGLLASMCGRPGRCEYGGMFSATWTCQGTSSVPFPAKSSARPKAELSVKGAINAGSSLVRRK